MTTGSSTDALTAAAELPEAVQRFASTSVAGANDDQLLHIVRLAERARRQLEACDAVLIEELDRRNLAGTHLMRSTARFLGALLNLAPREAHQRVRQARQLAPRLTASGQSLPPLLPAAADARARGAITAAHVDVIMSTVDKLPTSLSVSDIAAAERFLGDQAELVDAAILGNIARRLRDTLDPDGTLSDDRAHQRRRHLSCQPVGDGMYRLSGELDPETAALAMAVLHSLAAPRPGGDCAERSGSGSGAVSSGGGHSGGAGAAAGDGASAAGSQSGARDERTAEQRLHDALREVLKLALRANQLPRSGGIPATVLITMTAEQFETGTGLATTSFGHKLTVPTALRLADQASIAWVVHNSAGGVLNYGSAQRCATPSQTLALIARDGGCAFPGCTRPPEWTERHHIVPWREGGPTDIDNLCLLCDYHHDRIDTGGWRITVRDKLPWFIPPEWLDPAGQPRRNIRP